MIRNLKPKGLARFFRNDDRRGIPAQSAERIARILDRLDAATRPADMNIPGFRFHPLKGDRVGVYAVAVSGNVRIPFCFDGEDAIDVNMEDYH